MKSQTQTRKPAVKPVSKVAVSKPASKPAKPASKPETVSAKVAPKVEPAKPAMAVFGLVSGTIAQITHKGLRAAIAYHVSKGNLAKTDAGIKLTEQGALLWGKERVEGDAPRFSEIAAFVRAGGATPKEWNGQPITEAGGTLQGVKLHLPNMLYWGSFSTSDMRRAFAALWASKK